MAAAAARIIDPASKLATARALDPETASTSLGELLGLGPVSGNEMLDMLDWLLERETDMESEQRAAGPPVPVKRSAEDWSALVREFGPCPIEHNQELKIFSPIFRCRSIEKHFAQSAACPMGGARTWKSLTGSIGTKVHEAT